MNTIDKARLPHFTFGPGVSKQAGERVKNLGCKKCMIVTDKGVIAAGLVEPIITSLKDADIDYVIYDEVLPNCPDYICVEVAKLLNEEKCDCTLAVGGGSSIDTAKAANLIANFPTEIKDPSELHDYSMTGTKMRPWYTRTVKYIAVPTTAGTGAESTPTSVIYDRKLNLKYSFGNENVVSDLVLVDPELTYGMPLKPTIICGLDALTHAIEVTVSTVQQDFATPLALTVIDKIRRWLPVVVKDPKNKEARAQMAYAAAMSLSGGGFGNGHAVSHAIGARYNIVHGHACIMVMPALIRHHAESAAENIKKLADIFGVPKTGTNEEVAGYVADAVLKFYKDLGVDTCKNTIKAAGFDDDKRTFAENLVEPILDDFKSRIWMPPIHRPEDRERLLEFCEEIYDEE